MGSFTSKTMRASLQSFVPDGNPSFGWMVKNRLPSPSRLLTLGGRKPAVASDGYSPVADRWPPLPRGDARFQVEAREDAHHETVSPGSVTVVLHWLRPGGGVTAVSPKAMVLRLNVERSYFSTSSWSVTLTRTAGAVAVESFSKRI